MKERRNSLTDGFGTLTDSHPSAVIKSTQVENCLFGENVSISEKTSIKHSHFDTNSNVEPKTRVSNSVIMGNVTIKQG